MKSIVIVGGGFAGVKLARELRNINDIKVTLLSDQTDFRYSPALYRTATGGRKRESSIPLKPLLESFGTTFIQAKVAKIDRQKQWLYTDDGQGIPYDYCVLALGVVTSYFGIKGLDTFSYSIKSAGEVERLKRHLHEQLTHDHETDKNYVIVGAGPTGVELAGELGRYIKRIAKSHHVRRSKVTIELIEAAPRILPTMNEDASKIAMKTLEKLGVKVMVDSKVLGETKNTLKVGERSIPTHTVIWTAGVSNNPFYLANADQFNLDKRQRVVVDPYFTVDDHVFVIGDNPAVEHGGLAQTAIWHAQYVAHIIKQIMKHGSVEPYSQNSPTYAVPLGEHHAIVEWNGLVFGGIFGGLIRSIADLVGYVDILGIRSGFAIWRQRSGYEESCPVCRSPQVTQ